LFVVVHRSRKDELSGGNLKAEGFGDGAYERNHPQAALEVATLLNYQIKYERALSVQVAVHHSANFLNLSSICSFVRNPS
jgi:hypothetical protein